MFYLPTQEALKGNQAEEEKCDETGIKSADNEDPPPDTFEDDFEDDFEDP